MRQHWFCRGFALSVLVVLTMLASAPTAVPSAQEAAARLPAAREIIDRYVREIGGREAILAQSSTHVIGTVALPAAGISGEMETFHAKPNMFLQRLVLPGIGTVEEGFDGTVAWTMSPLTGPALIDGKQLEQRRFDADFYEELKPEGRYASMTTVEKTTFEERPAYKIKLVTKSRRRGLRVLRHGNRPQDRRRDDARVADGAGAQHDVVRRLQAVRRVAPANLDEDHVDEHADHADRLEGRVRNRRAVDVRGARARSRH